VPSADGEALYFTGKKREDSMGDEDIYLSVWENGQWQPARNLGGEINTVNNESANSVSADGNQLIIYGNFAESRGEGDNFYIEKTAEGWSEIRHFNWPINSIYFDSDGFLTADGKAMLFTSDRRGVVGDYHPKDQPFHGSTWGNTDIWVCAKTDSGWGEPVNLGKVINTPFAERSPFLHPDGKTLYFSSEGHYGLGRLDVFKATRLSDTSWTQWSSPVNLGAEINTAGDDWGYKISTSGEEAYFAASGDPQGYGGYDIYSVVLPSAARPRAVATIRGRVADEQDSPLPAAIKWENLSTGQVVGELASNPQNGNYFIVLPLGANYGYFAEKEGYYPVSANIDLSDSTAAVNIIHDITLVKIEEIKQTGTAVRINNIFFDFDKTELKPESYPELNRLAGILKQNPDVKIEISGHTDDVGSDDYNLELSLGRAQAVVDYLAAQGCSRLNLKPRGYGEARPVEPNQTESGRAANRRVEFKFLQ
jgi:outer membrane protein OmpA-like peptidoglycan-associated protein